MGSGALKPGDLDHRITIEALGPEVDDGMRVKPGGWFEVGRVFAGVSPLSGGERIAAGENAAFQLQKFRIRRPKAFTITAKQNRLIYASRTMTSLRCRKSTGPRSTWLQARAPTMRRKTCPA
jgi:head-tail adaptor